MILIKKYKSTIILSIISIIFILVNYILVENFNYLLSNHDIENEIEAVSNNYENLTDYDISNLNLNDKLKLANINYNNNNYEDAEKICLMILDKFPEDRETINLISAIYRINSNFDKSLEYLNILLPLSSGTDLFYLYNNISEHYILSDIDSAISYLEKSIKLTQESSIILGENEIEYIKLKLNDYNKLKTLKDGNKIYEFYKGIINSKFIDDYTKKYAYINYKDKYSSLYKEDFKEITSIYNSLNIN